MDSAKGKEAAMHNSGSFDYTGLTGEIIICPASVLPNGVTLVFPCWLPNSLHLLLLVILSVFVQ